MRLVYIAGPISKGDLAANINQGTAAFLALAKAGIASICPMWSAFSGKARRVGSHENIVYMRDGDSLDLRNCVLAIASAMPNELTHADWLKVDFEFIRRCDAVLRLPGESVGADAEIAEAKRLGIPVFVSVEDVIAWSAMPPDVAACA